MGQPRGQNKTLFSRAVFEGDFGQNCQEFPILRKFLQNDSSYDVIFHNLMKYSQASTFKDNLDLRENPTKR